MVYIDNLNEFKIKISNNFFIDKKVLFTFGDSWTNNTYIFNNGTYPKKTWPHQLAEKLEYDCVINFSTDGGSNDDIFEWCLNTMCLFDEYEFDKCRINEISAKEIKVVIGWSSQLRNFNSISKIFRPFNVTSIPYVVGMESYEPFRILYEKYIMNLHSEYYCYNTQLQTICLQHYFKHHKIESFYFMAFTPLLENELFDTKWDLRKEIDSIRFYRLNDRANSMCDTINKISDSNIESNFVIEQPFLSLNLKHYFGKLFSNKIGFSDLLQNTAEKNLNNKYFCVDGHPNENGLEVISNELFQLIKK